MARLIDADALMDKLRRMPIFEKTDFDKKMLYVEKSIIDDMPTVDVNNFGCKWIPVTERLPKRDGDYLVYRHNPYGGWLDVVGFAKDGRKVDEYDFEGEWENVWYSYDSEYGYLTIDSVTHWMYLPEPPKEV